VNALDHGFARRVLRLPKVQHHDAIGVGHVIGDADPLDFILLIADVVPRDPRAGLSASEPAIMASPRISMRRGRLSLFTRASRRYLASTACLT